MVTPLIRLRRLVLLACALQAAPAFASGPGLQRLDREASFHIESGPLESALIQFSRQAAVQVVLAPDSAAHFVPTAIQGRLAASRALDALLKGTGLVYTVVGNTVTVRPAESRSTALGSRTKINNQSSRSLR